MSLHYRQCEMGGASKRKAQRLGLFGLVGCQIDAELDWHKKSTNFVLYSTKAPEYKYYNNKHRETECRGWTGWWWNIAQPPKHWGYQIRHIMATVTCGQSSLNRIRRRSVQLCFESKTACTQISPILSELADILAFFWHWSSPLSPSIRKSPSERDANGLSGLATDHCRKQFTIFNIHFGPASVSGRRLICILIY